MKLLRMRVNVTANSKHKALLKGRKAFRKRKTFTTGTGYLDIKQISETTYSVFIYDVYIMDNMGIADYFRSICRRLYAAISRYFGIDTVVVIEK